MRIYSNKLNLLESSTIFFTSSTWKNTANGTVNTEKMELLKNLNI